MQRWAPIWDDGRGAESAAAKGVAYHHAGALQQYILEHSHDVGIHLQSHIDRERRAHCWSEARCLTAVREMGAG